MNKKQVLKAVVVSTFLIGATNTVSAKVSTLFKLTSNTYATSEHGDSYFADTYYGKVSVRGADRFYTGSYTAYPTYSQITYDVQGDKTVKKVSSKSKSDTTARKGSVTVKDKWNIGSKTKVYGKYGSGFVSNDAPYSLETD